MAEKALSTVAALDGHANTVTEVGGWRLTERTDLALASFAMRAAGTRVAEEMISELAGEMCDTGRYVEGPRFAMFHTGPGQWFVMAPSVDGSELSRELRAAFDDRASITDQSGGWTVFDLQGAGLSNVLERLCNVDLGRFAAGAATRTQIEHVGCFLICRGAEDFCISCPRSYAVSVHEAICAMMQSASALADD